jgi:hypothetical protein
MALALMCVLAGAASQAAIAGPGMTKDELIALLKEGELTLKEPLGEAPATLAEAHARLERILSEEALAKIDAMDSEDGMALCHFGLGMSIRNGWGLWRDSALAKHMKELGFTHPDDMSSTILATLWCKRHGQDLRLAERAAKYKAYWEAAKRAEEEEEKRVQQAKVAIRRMMMGLRFEKRDVPVLRMPSRGRYYRRARYLSRFRGGVFISVCLPRRTGRAAFVTPGYYFDPGDLAIHRIQIEEVNDVHSAVAMGDEAWFVGAKDGKAVLVGIGDQDRAVVPLPQDGEVPQLGIDGESLLAVYPQTIYRLMDRTWMLVHSGEITLPRSGPPPQRHGNMIFFRDEGRHENRKRLWWLTLGEQPQLSALDKDTGLVGSHGPRWENSFSYCVTKDGDLWACVGEGYSRKSLLRRSREGSYSIAILNNSVGFTEDLFGSKETDQGLSVSAVTALPDDTLVLVGDAGLYRLKGNELVQELAFTNSRQDVRDSNGRVVLHWHWNPSRVVVLDDGSYLISATFGGIYRLSKGHDGQWSFVSLDEKLGDPVVW